MDWQNPDYTEVFRERQLRLDKVRSNPILLQAMKKHYKNNPWDFINDWGMTFDPRQVEKGQLANIPFVLWPRQTDFLYWMDERWKAGEYGIVEKSRDCGVTWLSVGFCCTQWLFNSGFSAGFGSAKETKVDKKGDPDCIFEKIRFFINNIPKEFLPKDFNLNIHSSFMKLSNPENGATITGDSGLQIGRGGRKALTLETPVLTTGGWKKNGELSLNDCVINNSGKPTRIIGIQDHGRRKVYRVGFDDGTSVKCCGDHLWTVTTRSIRKANGRSTNEKRRTPHNITLSTNEMVDNVLVKRKDDNKEYQYQIPITAPVVFQEKDLPLDPYLLGLLLGDGCMPYTVNIVNSEPEIIKEIEDRVPEGISVSHAGITHRLVDYSAGGPKRSKMKIILDSLGVRNCLAPTKFVPKKYLFNSIENRLLILQGLLDTDGWVSKRKGAGKVCFASASIQLAKDVQFLAQSLGGVATLRTKKTTHLDSHEIILAMPDGINPFKLTRKAERVKTRALYQPRRSIISIEPDGTEPVRCITVENDNGLYLCNDFIVTHNSVWIIDEAAFIENQQAADNAISQATNCHIDVSTYNGNGNVFYRKSLKFEGTKHKFIFDWRQDPRKDDAWYAKQKAEKDPITVAQEIDRDPNASQSDSFIPADYVRAAVDLHKLIKIPPSGVRATGFDPADEGDAKAVVSKYGYIIQSAEMMKDGDITQAIPWAYQQAFNNHSQFLSYDADGMGAPVMKLTLDSYAAGNMPILPYYGSGEVVDKKKHLTNGEGIPDKTLKTNGDTYLNYRAQTATWLYDRFKASYDVRTQIESGGVALGVDADKIISIDSTCVHSFELIAELSRPKRVWTNNGKIKVESKKEMKKRGVESPNLFDALVIVNAIKAPSPTAIRRYKTRSIKIRDKGVGM